MTQNKIPTPWGTIEARPRKDGTLSYRLRGRLNGKLTTVDKADSIEELQAVATALKKREQSRRSNTLTLEKWIGTHAKRRKRDRRYRDGRESNRRVLERRVKGTRLGAMELRKIGPDDVRKWVAAVANGDATCGKRQGEPLARNTVRNALRALSACMADAIEAGELKANPCIGVKVPREAPRTDDTWHALNAAELALLRDARPTMPAKQWAAFTLATYSGLRQGEVWGLCWEDVRDLDGDHPYLIVRHSYDGPTKGNQVREVPLFPPAVEALHYWRQHLTGARPRGLVGAQVVALAARRGTGPVFPGPRGKAHRCPYDGGWRDKWSVPREDGARDRIPGWRTRLGIRPEVRFHDLRHTFAVCLVSGQWGRCWRLEEIQRLMGHQSRTTTERYAHLAPDGVRRAFREAVGQWEEGS